MKLLEQNEKCRIGDKLEELQQLTETLAFDDGGRSINRSGPGNNTVNKSGDPNICKIGGSSDRQIIIQAYITRAIPVRRLGTSALTCNMRRLRCMYLVIQAQADRCHDSSHVFITQRQVLV